MTGILLGKITEQDGCSPIFLPCAHTKNYLSDSGKKNKLNKYSLKDIIEISKLIHKMKINEKWKLSEMSKKTQQLLKDIQIDYLNERS